MSVESRYDILLQPIAIGPVTARNRFYQVPHCTGMGYRDPTALAHMRGIKAEGGWAVVCTEQVEFHWTSEITPFIELRLWDDRDIPMLARMADHIHAHGALAGLELCYNACTAQLLFARSADGADGTHHRELHLRTPPGAHHGQGGHPQRPPLAQGGGASRQASGFTT